MILLQKEPQKIFFCAFTPISERYISLSSMADLKHLPKSGEVLLSKIQKNMGKAWDTQRKSGKPKLPAFATLFIQF